MIRTLTLAVLLAVLSGLAGVVLWLALDAVREQVAGRPEVVRRLAVFAGAWLGLVVLWLVLLAGWLVPAAFLAGAVVAVLTLPGWLRRLAAARRRPLPRPIPHSRPYRLADHPDVPIEEVIAAAEAEADPPPGSPP